MATIVIVLVVIVLVVGISAFNTLRSASVGVEKDFSGITVQLERRADLIPNLVNTVKGYAKHESETLLKVVEARSKATNGNITPENASKLAEAEGQIGGALSKLLAISEGYPDLKANQNFLQLQAEISDTEDKIASSRNLYNNSVTKLNTAMTTFPGLLFVGIAGVKKAEMYKVSEERQETIETAPDVQF
ncbi:MAG: LemA family protein [Bifidobacteriaceae bacterium]|jgi:LemA protein|nr:LemA family protein [Bifidobacteriaceae bacterium]